MPLELGLRLNINELVADGIIRRGQDIPLTDFHWFDADGEVQAVAKIGADLTTPDRGTMLIVAGWINQTLQLAAHSRHFGGHQWYFLCPRRREYVSVLWRMPGSRLFAGRKSWGKHVAYLSQFYAPDSRAHHMAVKLCERIGGPGTAEEWRVPPKPKWMRWRTYDRLAEDCERYRAVSALLPKEYRLASDTD